MIKFEKVEFKNSLILDKNKDLQDVLKINKVIQIRNCFLTLNYLQGMQNQVAIFLQLE